MSLPTCPSCGQSVLEDNAVDCPFCGAAMDGSRGAKNTPRPKASPVTNRPGARKVPEKTAAPSNPDSAPSPAEIPKPIARPAAAPRGGKPVVDEDDPFGVGSAAAAAQAILATEKPEKGRLQKVVCPMCEKTNFIPKAALGKSVRCANPKCLVPVFTATDPSEQTTDRGRRPSRLSDDAEAARKATENSRPAKRNPLIVYGIVGGVLLVLTLILVLFLKKQPDTSNLNKPAVISDFGATEEEELRIAAEAAASKKAAEDAKDPGLEVAGLSKRMISLARQPNLRDKAWARRMTGDLYLRLNDPKSASQEFSQLLVVERTRGYYRINPHLALYWRAIATGDAETAKKALADTLPELQSLPRTGRLGIDAALGMAAALVNDERTDDAVQLLTARQLDTTIADNRDAIASTAWSFVAYRCRDAGISPPTMQDALLWSNPLHAAVAQDLAIHQRWTEAIAWSNIATDARAITDALVEVATLAGVLQAGPEVFTQIESAVSAADPVSALRVRGAVAAAARDAARLDACIASFSQLTAPVPVSAPTANQLVQDDIQERANYLYQAIAVAEVVRAGAATGKTDQAAIAMTRFLTDLAAVAPSAVGIRNLVNRMTINEAAFRKELAAELRVSEGTQFTTMFRNYRRHLEQLARLTEDRRLLEILLLSRVVNVGGTSVVQQALSASPEFKQDLLLDELSGLLAISAIQSGAQFPEVVSVAPEMRQGRAQFGNAELIVGIAAMAEQAWANRYQNLPACLQALETGAGTELPGLRQALACELVEDVSGESKSPVDVLNAISQLSNPVWREESYILSGWIFGDRKLDKEADAWLPGVKIPAMEQISLLYGLSLGILERRLPATRAANGSGGGK